MWARVRLSNGASNPHIQRTRHFLFPRLFPFPCLLTIFFLEFSSPCRGLGSPKGPDAKRRVGWVGRLKWHGARVCSVMVSEVCVGVWQSARRWSARVASRREAWKRTMGL